jgi:hypothetical protein
VSGRRWRALLIFAASPANATFSYQQAWPRLMQAHPRFQITPLNLAGLSVAGRLSANVAVRRWSGDAIVLLHSVFSNAQFLDGRLLEAVASRSEPKAYFIGNEYKAMPEKMSFCETLRLSLLVSQSSDLDVHRLYRERLGCAVVGIPNTGLDPAGFRPERTRDERPIDLGYRADASPAYLGHKERTDIADYFRAHAEGFDLKVDISLDARDRFDERGWAAFLNQCKGQLGTEAGGDYFELTDRTRRLVNTYEQEHPGATFDEIHDRFFRDYCRSVPMRIISGRNVEAAGTKTVQVLFDGRYDGYLQPDEHYIALKKDFSNADEAIRKFADRAFAESIAENAYRLATSELTYDKLIDRFETALAGVASPNAVHS